MADRDLGIPGEELPGRTAPPTSSPGTTPTRTSRRPGRSTPRARRRARRRQRRARRRPGARQDRRRDADHRHPRARLRGPEGEDHDRRARLRAPRSGVREVLPDGAARARPLPQRRGDRAPRGLRRRRRTAWSTSRKHKQARRWCSTPSPTGSAASRSASRTGSTCTSPRRRSRSLGDGRASTHAAHRAHPAGSATAPSRAPASVTNWDVQAVYRAVGYRSTPLPGLPFDDRAAVIPNDGGRVLDLDGDPIPGTYVTGWIKRGPVGLIGHTKSDAAETVGHLLAETTPTATCREPERRRRLPRRARRRRRDLRPLGAPRPARDRPRRGRRVASGSRSPNGPRCCASACTDCCGRQSSFPACAIRRACQRSCADSGSEVDALYRLGRSAYPRRTPQCKEAAWSIL